MKLRAVFCDESGQVYDHPRLEMAGLDGPEPRGVRMDDVVPVPRGSDLMILPGRSPLGFDPDSGRPVTIETWEGLPVHGAAVFMAPAYTQTLRPAYVTREEAPGLPLYAYTALGFAGGQLWAGGVRVDADPRQDPWRFKMSLIEKGIEDRLQHLEQNRLFQQLIRCAMEYGCRAAQNYFLVRWEAPLPTSIACNSKCVGCLSLQPDGTFKASHERLDVPPTAEEVAELAVGHIRRVKGAVVSFGQGCEGEPLLMGELLERSIQLIRKKTDQGTINLNTNGSLPQVVEQLFQSGLDSIRVSLNSSRPELYTAYFKPKGYRFGDVIESLRIAKRYNRFSSINLFIFPGVTDTPSEYTTLVAVMQDVKPDMIQMRNLNIDPEIYIQSLPGDALEDGFGVKELMARLKEQFPHLRFGYFNPPKETF